MSAAPTTVTTTIEWLPSTALTVGLGGVVIVPKQQALPGLYRFTIGEASGSTWLYIGEAANLQRRMLQYAKPAAASAAYAGLAQRIRDALLDEGTVALAVATAVTIDVNGQAVSVDLIRPTDRRLAENAALVAARFEGADQILNADSAQD